MWCAASFVLLRGRALFVKAVGREIQKTYRVTGTSEILDVDSDHSIFVLGFLLGRHVGLLCCAVTGLLKKKHAGRERVAGKFGELRKRVA